MVCHIKYYNAHDIHFSKVVYIHLQRFYKKKTGIVHTDVLVLIWASNSSSWQYMWIVRPYSVNAHAQAKGGGEEGKILSLAHELSPNTVWFTRLACGQTCALYL